MNLSPHFTLSELTYSGTARRLGLSNDPDETALANLHNTAALLERIRVLLGVPLIVSSGYRGPAVNRAVGGVSTSDHAKGMAADFTAFGYGTPYEICCKLAPSVAALGIGQLILESVGGKKWVHVSTRMQAKKVNRIITIHGSKVFPGIDRRGA